MSKLTVFILIFFMLSLVGIYFYYEGRLSSKDVELKNARQAVETQKIQVEAAENRHAALVTAMEERDKDYQEQLKNISNTLVIVRTESTRAAQIQARLLEQFESVESEVEQVLDEDVESEIQAKIASVYPQYAHGEISIIKDSESKSEAWKMDRIAVNAIMHSLREVLFLREFSEVSMIEKHSLRNEIHLLKQERDIFAMSVEDWKNRATSAESLVLEQGLLVDSLDSERILLNTQLRSVKRQRLFGWGAVGAVGVLLLLK